MSYNLKNNSFLYQFGRMIILTAILAIVLGDRGEKQ
jgi:hypothetical protein